MDGSMNEWMDGWMNIDRWTNGQMNKQIMDEWTHVMILYFYIIF